jgi:hypothetical protein
LLLILVQAPAPQAARLAAFAPIERFLNILPQSRIVLVSFCRVSLMRWIVRPGRQANQLPISTDWPTSPPHGIEGYISKGTRTARQSENIPPDDPQWLDPQLHLLDSIY